MWQQRSKGQNVVALGPVVITFLHKPQRRHQGPGARHDIQIKQPLVPNYMWSKLCIHLFRSDPLAECMIHELNGTGWWGVLTLNETSNMWRKKSKSSHRYHKGHAATQWTWCQRKATSDCCLQTCQVQSSLGKALRFWAKKKKKKRIPKIHCIPLLTIH